jgi:hypothetical protein
MNAKGWEGDWMGMWKRLAMNWAWEGLPTLCSLADGEDGDLDGDLLSDGVKLVGMTQLVGVLFDEIHGEGFVGLSDLVETIFGTVNGITDEFLLLCVGGGVAT